MSCKLCILKPPVRSPTYCSHFLNTLSSLWCIRKNVFERRRVVAFRCSQARIMNCHCQGLGSWNDFIFVPSPCLPSSCTMSKFVVSFMLLNVSQKDEQRLQVYFWPGVVVSIVVHELVPFAYSYLKFPCLVGDLYERQLQCCVLSSKLK